MKNLSLVKKLSYFKDEQKFSQEFIEINGLCLLRGSLTEVIGEGKTSLSLMLLSALTRSGEICSIVDHSNSFDPHSAEFNNVILENLLWVKCGGSIENAFSATDQLIQAKGFGSIWLHLNNLSAHDLNSIPSSYWYRFRTKIKDSQTLLVVTVQRPVLGSASTQSFYLDKYQTVWLGSGRFKLLKELQINLNARKPFSIKPIFKRIGAKY
jgi:hypothetical protein